MRAPFKKLIFDKNNNYIIANNINGYLLDADDTYVESRKHPICDVPELLTGSQRIDGDAFMFTDETKQEFVKKEPESEQYFKLWYGADEFLYASPRRCLYLGDVDLDKIKKIPECMKLVEKVREYRLKSKRSATVKVASKPNKFGLEIIPKTNYMIIPVVTLEKRTYIPMGFMTPDVLCSN